MRSGVILKVIFSNMGDNFEVLRVAGSFKTFRYCQELLLGFGLFFLIQF